MKFVWQRMAEMTRRNFRVCQHSLRVAPGQSTTHSLMRTPIHMNIWRPPYWNVCPDTEKDRLVAHERLSRRQLREGESIDELAGDVEKLLDQALPGLPGELRESELRFYLLPEKVSIQLKLQPKCSYVETIARCKELLLIYSRAETSGCVNQVQTKDDQRLQKLEETMQWMSEQLTAISVQPTGSPTAGRCFSCGKHGHLARNCRACFQQVECFNCGGQGHIAQNCWKRQGNGRGSTPIRQAGRAPGLN